MTNFNTNQTRHFYVAGAINDNVGKDLNAGGTAAASKLDIALGSTATGEMFFVYKNNDGLITRSDSFDPKKIVSLKKTTAAQMATKLLMAEVEADTNVIDFSSTSSFIGKAINLHVTLHGLYDYDDANSTVAIASVVGDATNLASKAAFTKAMAVAVAKSLPKGNPSFPYVRVFYGNTEVTAKTKVSDLSGSTAKFKIVQGPQKFVRNKLNGQPVNFSISSVANGEPWLTEESSELKPSDITGYQVIPASYVLADLEAFALGERGDYIRGFDYPNNYEPTYAISLNGTYSVLSIEYYWNGNAENVQKSPRLIQVAAPETESNDIVTDLYDAISRYVSQ